MTLYSVCVCKTEHGLYMTPITSTQYKTATESRCGGSVFGQAACASAGLSYSSGARRRAPIDFTVTAGGGPAPLT